MDDSGDWQLITKLRQQLADLEDDYERLENRYNKLVELISRLNDEIIPF
jgi:cell division protein FtsB